MFANRLKKRLSHLRKWAKRTRVAAFRLYDRDIPEIPLVLDAYGANGAIDMACGSLYKRPYEKDAAEEALWLELMRGAASQALEIAQDSIMVKSRERQRGDGMGGNRTQYEKLSCQKLIREIPEGDFIFKVNVSDYLDTGLFLDRRLLRRMIQDDSEGRRVLNLFCYTSSFSVYAAGGGAASTCSVDLSNTYLGWSRENFSLNSIASGSMRMEDYCRRGNAHGNTLVKADVPVFIRHALEKRMQWDSIILDPPAFSNSSMAEADFDLLRDYESLITNCLALLARGGKLWFSASSRSFKADAAALASSLGGRYPGIKITDIGDKIIDEDFKGKKMPRTFILEPGA